MPELIILVGLPGAGKSMFAEQYTKENDFVIISSDDMREQLFGDVNNQDNNAELFEVINSSVRNCLECKQNVIYDATNISAKRRKAFLNYISKVPCNKKCIVVATPYENCLENNNNRERIVPENVINRMYKNFQMPWYFEGWDEIKIYYPMAEYENKYRCPSKFCDKYLNYDQLNPHHNDTLGTHCIKVAWNFNDPLMRETGFLHDCGKPFTFSRDEKGVAHYYGHEYCGAYESLFYDSITNKVERAALITYHMAPFSWNNDDTNKKFKNLWGEDFYNKIIKLHEADIKH